MVNYYGENYYGEWCGEKVHGAVKPHLLFSG
jgi:hypothetical protein